ncbi:MAG: DUF1573 domain-containing protein [Verrucomicrobia bacterium]|nr:DUF1573 domain-containing protein [Kiritimatiellia bacterium]MCB1102379.1 DUF1573 domain-containing protein [Kiritimatiellia bacterium]MCP5487033.1 DUF1573 domain-containing protein [Verrucomicrobiota bacterium]
MKKAIVILFASLLWIQSEARAQEPAATENPDAASGQVQGPRIASDEPVFDFGMADNAQPVEHTFVVRNDGDTTLVIERVRPTCGCTVANISNKELKPGDTSEISTRLNLPGRTGKQNKTLIVYSNDPQNPEYRLTLTGEMTTAIKVEPTRHFFGQVQPGQKISLDVTLEATSDQNFSITGIEGSVPDITADVEVLEQGRKYKIKAHLKASDNPGVYQANLKILTDHPARGVVDIPISGNVVGDILVAPQDITLSLQHESAVTRYIVVRPGAATTFELTEVIPPDPAIKVNIFPFGDKGYRIQLENIVASRELDGKEILLRTSVPSSPELKVPFRILE